MLNLRAIYNVKKANNEPMLSNYNAPFWADYVANFARYDRLIMRRYGFFIPVAQVGNEVDIADDFAEDVYEYLLINKKRFEELYRIQMVSDADDPLTFNYDLKEELHRSTASNIGQQTIDSTSGAQHGVTSDKVSPEDSESFFNRGQQESNIDAQTNQTNAGARADSGSEDYTLTRVGNIGTQTASDMLQKHRDIWSGWNFYKMIIEEIIQQYCVIDADEYTEYVAHAHDDRIIDKLNELEDKIDHFDPEVQVEVDFAPVNQKIDAATTAIRAEVIQGVTDVIEHEDSLYDNTVEAFDNLGTKIDESTADIITAVNGVATDEY